MAKEHGPVGVARGGGREPHSMASGTRGGDEHTAGGGSGGQPPGDGNNTTPDSGYRHWHHLGGVKPPGWGIGEVKAPDSGSHLNAKGDRPPKHDPAPGKMDPMRQVGPNVKPVGS